MHSSSTLATLFVAGVSAAGYTPQGYGSSSSSSSSSAVVGYGTGAPALPSFTLAPQEVKSSSASTSTCTEEEGRVGPASGYGPGYPVGTGGFSWGVAKATGGIHDTCGNLGKGLSCITRTVHFHPTGAHSGRPLPTGFNRYKEGYGPVRRGYGHGQGREHGGQFGVLQASGGLFHPDCVVDYPGSYSSTVDAKGAPQVVPVGPTVVDCWSAGFPSAQGTGPVPAATTTAPPAVGNAYASSSVAANAYVPKSYGV
ncbi:hypothetical protein BDV96DRAFT_654674 [Lophiotrema nucula]|uniref:Uncharacterized protein n=1 Tax=Lophiotrema nucula TaxID=690887 RepID=A0A6A5YGT9_9PLEO|nr:hypothetical protein BDV96DRAFT_654674 [Lophiotrema nucula]